MKRVMIVDQNNMFIRHYIIDPSLANNGQPVGGVMGSLKGFQKFLRDIKPDMVIICWDGSGGSKRRKQMNKDYKAGRSPIRLNRTVKVITNEQEELENKIWQMTRLSEYFDEMPVVQFLFDDVEADDVIAYAAKMDYFEDWQKVIVSSDKDFIQLLDEKTILFRPIQKQIMSLNNIVDLYGVHPNNFALARALVGDKSDNLDGIRGIGMGTVAKRLPFLSESKTFTIKDVIDYSKKRAELKTAPKAFQAIADSKKIISENYKMMQLSTPNISVRTTNKVRKAIESFEPTFRKTEIRTMMLKDGFPNWTWDTLFQTFNRYTSKDSKEG